MSNIPPPRSAGTLYRARKRLHWPSNRDFRILSIDGGGIRGILPLAILARLESSYLAGTSISNCFDLVAGTSTGGVVALGLGAGLTASQILALYVDRGGEVFPDYGWVARKWLGAAHLFLNRCDRQQLDGLIDSVVGGRQIWESRHRLCIPAAETRHFEPFIFKTPHHQDYRQDWAQSMAHVAKTTSAAPTYFRPVERADGYEFVDGGIWANNPIMVAVTDALACFDVPRERIKVLSFGCVRASFEMSWARRHLGGLWFWRTLMIESMHLQSQNVVGQARLILGGDRVVRIDSDPISPKLELFDWARCRDVLPGVADGIVASVGGLAARFFLSDAAEPYRPFYTPHSPPSAL